MKMNKITILLAIFNFCAIVNAQSDSIRKQNLAETRVDRNFEANYRSTLYRLRRTYPLALEAKRMIMEYEKELSQIDKKRRQKKYGKDAHSSLKEEFTFNIKDLYTTEGDLLIRLIHRETGMTVSEIIKRYRGGTQTTISEGMAKIWGHDLDAKYDPHGEDWICELIIQDIQNGFIPFDFTMNKLDKEAYKEGMKEYREDKRQYRKNKRETKRNKKK